MNTDKTEETKTAEALTLDRLYRSGMAVADCLRLLGRHEECNQVEVWTINNAKGVRNAQ